MTNIEFLDAAMKAYNEVPNIKILKEGKLEVVFTSVIYRGDTLDDIVNKIRQHCSETFIFTVKENREEYERNNPDFIA